MFTAHSFMNVGSRSLPTHGGSTSSTECPSDDSSSAASRTPRSASGSIGASIGPSSATAIRSRPGSRRAESANGSDGGGAQVESPSS